MLWWVIPGLVGSALGALVAGWLARRRLAPLRRRLEDAEADVRLAARHLGRAERDLEDAEARAGALLARAEAESLSLSRELDASERIRRSLVVEAGAMRRRLDERSEHEPGNRRSHTGTLLGIPAQREEARDSAAPTPDSLPPAADATPSAAADEAAWLRREVGRLADAVASHALRVEGLERDLEAARAEAVVLEAALGRARDGSPGGPDGDAPRAAQPGAPEG